MLTDDEAPVTQRVHVPLVIRIPIDVVLEADGDEPAPATKRPLDIDPPVSQLGSSRPVTQSYIRELRRWKERESA